MYLLRFFCAVFLCSWSGRGGESASTHTQAAEKEPADGVKGNVEPCCAVKWDP